MKASHDEFRSTRLLRSTLSLAAAAVLSAAGCGQGPDHRPTPNIVIVSLDTTRADHLGCYGYFRDTTPVLDAFAEEAVFFEQAYAPVSMTLPSHVSLFTGLHSLEHGIHMNARMGGRRFGWKPGVTTLTELLAARGYETGGFVSATPLKRESGFGRGFDVFTEPSQRLRKAAATTDDALAWLDGRRDERFFLFVHYFDPHRPCEPPPPYDTMFSTDSATEAYIAERRMPDALDDTPCNHGGNTREIMNLYDGEIRSMDDQIGRIFDRLRALGYWDDALIIVVGDHGQGLNQHDWPGHGQVWNEMMQVPLMIRFPQGTTGLPERVSTLTSITDVVPTALGRFTGPWIDEFMTQASGADVLAPEFTERPLIGQRTARECGPAAGAEYVLITPRWRYHHNPTSPDRDGRLFDLSVDPHELHDVAASDTAVADELRGRAEDLIAFLTTRGEQFGSAGTSALDGKTLRELRALGYLGAPGDDEPPADDTP